MVQVHPGPPSKSPVNTRLFSLFPFRGIPLEKPICQLFAKFSGNHRRLRGRPLSGGESFFTSAGEVDSPKWVRQQEHKERGWSGRGSGAFLRGRLRAERPSIRNYKLKGRSPGLCAPTRQAAACISGLTMGNRISCVGAAGLSDQGSSDSRSHGCFSLTLKPLTQSLLRYQSATPHADCGQVFVLNGVIEDPTRKASHFSGFARSIRHSR